MMVILRRRQEREEKMPSVGTATTPSLKRRVVIAEPIKEEKPGPSSSLNSQNDLEGPKPPESKTNKKVQIREPEFSPLSASVKRIGFGLLLTFIASAVIRVVMQLDLDKAAYNHKPGKCTVLGKLGNSTGHIEYVPAFDVLFVSRGFDAPSTAPHRAGSIGILHVQPPRNDTPWDRVAVGKPLEMDVAPSSDFDKSRFLPLGLSSLVYKNRALLYVINAFQDSNRTVEVFSFIKNSKKLTHLKTISDALFHSIRDVQVLGAGDRLALTSGFYSSWTRPFEALLQTQTGSLLVYDGKKAKVADENLALPTGLALDNDRRILYVAQFTGEAIRAYQLALDMTLAPLNEISLMSSPYAIVVDRGTGNLWVTAQPVFYRFVQQIWSDARTQNPSHVLHIRIQEPRDSWTITEPLANDGSGVSGATGLAIVDDVLVVGTALNKAIACHMRDPEIA